MIRTVWCWLVLVVLGWIGQPLAMAAEPEAESDDISTCESVISFTDMALEAGPRVLFLGDSITAGGGYVSLFDAWLLVRDPKKEYTVINCGLPSETISGLSEEGHAGGKFPRPDLFERLDRVLALTKPDVVFACYGINCGIYEPFDENRFLRYQQGWQKLREKVHASGPHTFLVTVTPPFYDDLRAPKPFSYNEVLDQYSEWLTKQGRRNRLLTIDLHKPMTAAVLKERETDPKFTVQPDGVHPNERGHWLIAQQLISAMKPYQYRSIVNKEAPKRKPLPDVLDCKTPEEFFSSRKISPEVLKLVHQRMSILRDAYVAAAGHKRPGVAKGLPIDEATKKADELTGKIRELLAK